MWTPDERFHYIYARRLFLQTGDNPQYSSYRYVVIITMLGNDHYHKNIRLKDKEKIFRMAYPLLAI